MRDLPFVREVLHKEAGYSSIVVNFTQMYRIGDIVAELSNPRINYERAVSIAVSIYKNNFDATKALLLSSIFADDKSDFGLDDVEDCDFPLHPLIDGHTRLMAIFLACYLKSYIEGSVIDSININHSHQHYLDDEAYYKLIGEAFLYIIDNNSNYELFRLNAEQYDTEEHEGFIKVYANVKEGDTEKRADVLEQMIQANMQSPFSDREIRDIVYKLISFDNKTSYSYIARVLNCTLAKAKMYVSMSLFLRNINLGETELKALHAHLFSEYGEYYYRDKNAMCRRDDLVELSLMESPKRFVILKAIYSGEGCINTSEFSEFEKYFKYLPIKCIKEDSQEDSQEDSVVIVDNEVSKEIPDHILLKAETTTENIQDNIENHVQIHASVSTTAEKEKKWLNKEKSNKGDSSHFIEVVEQKLFEALGEIKDLEKKLNVHLIPYDNNSLEEQNIRLSSTIPILYGTDFEEIARGVKSFPSTALENNADITYIWTKLFVLGGLHPRLMKNQPLLKNPVLMMRYLMEWKRKVS